MRSESISDVKSECVNCARSEDVNGKSSEVSMMRGVMFKPISSHCAYLCTHTHM